MQQQAQVVALSDVFGYTAGAEPEDVDLWLPKTLARRCNSLEFAYVAACHRCANRHAVILGYRFDIFKTKLSERRPQPTARGKKSRGAPNAPIDLVRVIIGFKIDKIGGDDVVDQNSIAGLNQAKRCNRHLLVFIEAQVFLLHGKRPTIPIVTPNGLKESDIGRLVTTVSG
jgi:hypothetical protein